jgi:hypothetical protein
VKLPLSRYTSRVDRQLHLGWLSAILGKNQTRRWYLSDCDAQNTENRKLTENKNIYDGSFGQPSKCVGTINISFFRDGLRICDCTVMEDRTISVLSAEHDIKGISRDLIKVLIPAPVWTAWGKPLDFKSSRCTRKTQTGQFPNKRVQICQYTKLHVTVA